jgi:hypothetical protein
MSVSTPELEAEKYKFLVEMNEIVKVTYRVDATTPDEAVRMCVEDEDVHPATKEVEFVGVHSVAGVYKAV